MEPEDFLIGEQREDYLEDDRYGFPRVEDRED
jgi:hypothetical protein